LSLLRTYGTLIADERPLAGIVVNLEHAAGKAGSYGVYLKIEYGF